MNSATSGVRLSVSFGHGAAWLDCRLYPAKTRPSGHELLQEDHGEMASRFAIAVTRTSLSRLPAQRDCPW